VELLLTVRFTSSSTSAATQSIDVAVELDPFTSVATLRDALVEEGTARGLAVPASPVLASASSAIAAPLADATSVFDAGLLSGHVVDVVAREALPTTGAAGAARDAAEQVLFDVTSGPETGRTITLPPGRHVVGRAPDCEVVLDDGSVSRRHFSVEVSPTQEVTILPDSRAANGTFVAPSWLDGPRRLRPEEAVVVGSTQLVLRAARRNAGGARDRLGQLSFNRVPYRRPIIRERSFEPLPKPPEQASRSRFSIVAVILPVLGAAGFAVLTKRLEFLALAALSPMMMISNAVTEGRHSRRSYGSQSRTFKEAVEKRTAEVDAALAEERRERMVAWPDIPLLGREARDRSARLWERPHDAPNFLELRLGLGRQPSRVQTTIETGGDPPLRDEALARLAHHTVLDLVPVPLTLDSAGTAGMAGGPDEVRALAAALVIQAATLHSPEEIVVAAAIPAETAGAWGWLKWLPHTRSATSPLDGAHLTDEQGTNDLLRRLLAVAADRSGRRDHQERPRPRVLLVLDEDAGVDRSLLSTFLEVSHAAGIITLWVGRREEQMPRQCTAVVRCTDPRRGASVLRSTDPSIDDQDFELEGISATVAATIARALAPVRDTSGSSVTTGIPKVVPFLDAVALPLPDGAAVARRWQASRPYGLVGTLGTGADGPAALDLVAQGPHTLIAGTSGSGKSELLQTLVLALAVEYPPERLGFLFIDYKGGAASADFAELPHTMGSVTNLDGRLALRALVSLRAELSRRMSVLEGRAKDLAEMLGTAPAEAPPSMVIVVDEFATLVKEIPDFVDGIVDVAQRGRSLGIHLVLATQRPGGAVNDNILANTNLRIALRVLDPNDSTAVLGAKDAASIPVPLRGRAFARTGPGPLLPFQCAWTGAPFAPDEQASAVVVRPFRSFSGRTSSSRQPADKGDAATGSTATRGREPPKAESQLNVTVRACRDAAAEVGCAPIRRPWVEPLPEVVTLDELDVRDPAGAGRRRADPGRWVALGLGDVPQEQRQEVTVVDLEATGGLMVYGAGGSGKTTLVRSLAVGLARQGAPEDVQVYVLDFGGRSLTQAEELPHVVAAVAGADLERAARVLTVLKAALDERRQLFADARADSMSALRAQPGAPRIPRIVVLLDNFAGFASSFEGGNLYAWSQMFQQLVIEGRQVGIHFVITANRHLGIPTALTSAMAARVVLRMATPEELMTLGVPRDAAKGAELGDGRGFTHRNIEVQLATVSGDPSSVAQAEALSAAASKITAGGATPVRRLVQLPDLVTTLPPPEHQLRIPLGVADLTLEPVEVDLVRQNLVVFGAPTSGRSSAVATVALGLAAAPGAPPLVGLGGLTSPLGDLDCWKVSGFGRSQHAAAIDQAGALVAGYEGSEVLLVLVIDAVEDLGAMELGARLEALVRSDAVRVVAVAEPVTIDRAFSGWVSELKRNRACLVLQPAGSSAVEALTGVKAPLRPGQPFVAGRGVLVTHGRPTLLQVAWSGSPD